MKNWIVQPPAFVRWLFPGSLWRLEKRRRCVALTFDDGPVPEQTPWVISTLEKYHIKATFFCVGDNIRKYPDLFAQLKSSGHTVGNHTFNHIQPFHNSWKSYMANIDASRRIDGGATLFRPPHGQMMPWRITPLRKIFDKVVFWDVMPRDYDQRLTPAQVLDNVKRHVRNGSIINFHDSVKAGERMRFALIGTIEYLLAEGYEFVELK